MSGESGEVDKMTKKPPPNPRYTLVSVQQFLRNAITQNNKQASFQAEEDVKTPTGSL